jgi:hypothetical protein
VRYLTDFADQAVILPLVFATAVALAVQGWWRGAAIWLIVVGATFLTTLTFKLMFLACSPLFGPLDVHSPSGHVAAATVVTGGSGDRAHPPPCQHLSCRINGCGRNRHFTFDARHACASRSHGWRSDRACRCRRLDAVCWTASGTQACTADWNYRRDRGPVSRLASASRGCDPSHGIPRSPKHPGLPCDTRISTPSGNRAVSAARGTVLTELL